MAERPRQRRYILDTLLLGLVGALAAQVFALLISGANAVLLGFVAGYQPPGVPGDGGRLDQIVGSHGLWLIPLVTTLGGLLVGLLTERLAPEAEGHGTDTAVRAFHRGGGAIRARVPPVKLVASAITIGSGGAAGREGPVALITAGLGSWYANLTGRDERDRQLLLLVGMAAGLAAIFRSPVGTALFVIEVLYADMVFESGALLYAMLAAIVAYAVNGLFVGWRPLFDIPPDITVPGVWTQGWYVVLGIAAGVVAAIIPQVFYAARDAFARLPGPRWLRPAVGGLVTGVIALALPQVLGGGYGWIQQAMAGRLTLLTLLALTVAKIVAFSSTVGSGGSGGVFAPSLFVGAMLGGSLATLLGLPPAPFVVVGMAAVFGGAARVPIATMMMVTEMTGGYALLVPAALAVLVSYLVQARLTSGRRHRSLYEAQVPGRADSPAHHSEHLRIALRILKERGVTDPAAVGQLDLLALLRSGLPAQLPDDRRLVVGVLSKGSRHVGRDLSADQGSLDPDTQVVAIMRGERMRVVRPGETLQAGDRLILLTTSAGWERLRQDVVPW